MITSLVEEKLQRLGQEGLLRLSLTSSLEKQILSIDESTFSIQKKLIQKQVLPERKLQPFKNFSFSGSVQDQNRGKHLLSEGKVGCIIMAGGQGTRLGFNGPKGCFPISLLRKKSLFQIFAEKIQVASIVSKHMLPVAIMTSHGNHDQTIDFFEKQFHFGLSKDQVHFFTQEEWPVLNLEGNLFLESSECLAMSPNGNGSTLRLFYQSGIWHKWKEKGIDSAYLMTVDNPLADPFDCEIIGMHHRMENEISIKAVKKTKAEEKVGVLAENEGKLQVIEYTELSDKERTAIENGELKYGIANISQFCFDMNFIESVAHKNDRLPIHCVKKCVKAFNPLNNPSSIALNAWKFEEYIFDVLAFSEKIYSLVYPREKVFAPLKNLEGEDSIKTVREALQNADVQMFCHVSGTDISEVEKAKPFELSQQFYYPTPELFRKWKAGLPVNHSYVE